jgi:hypothetical protein
MDNKLIAEFMYGKKEVYDLPQFGYIKSNGSWQDEFSIEQMKFNKDWNWLMQVVEKIEDLGYVVNISGISCTITEVLSDEPIVSWVLGDRTNKINLVYTTCVEFIKIYNNK